jgi:hypothetical protein
VVPRQEAVWKTQLIILLDVELVYKFDLAPIREGGKDEAGR